MLEEEALKAGHTLSEPIVRPLDPKATAGHQPARPFSGIFKTRIFMIWMLWICVYMLNNSLVTRLSTLYKQTINLPLQTSLAHGRVTSTAGVDASTSAHC